MKAALLFLLLAQADLSDSKNFTTPSYVPSYFTNETAHDTAGMADRKEEDDLAQTAPPVVQMPQQPFEVPMQQPVQKPPLPPASIPENLKNWPKSCQRLHLETNKCENGLKSCNQRRIAYWRKKCESDEPHDQ